ncbi:MAG: DNA translocase FtsK [Bacilli bacterium]|nr:DNA translocase FtsK [Bacilli bacterium]
MRRKNFYIAKINEDTNQEKVKNNQKEEKKFKPEPFVSSYTGYNVKDKPSFPYIKWNNRGSQYEGLRDSRRISDEERKELYGTEYYEFAQILKPTINGEALGVNEEEDEENEPEDKMGHLKDLPEIDDEYDFFSNTISAKNRNPEFKPRITDTTAPSVEIYSSPEKKNPLSNTIGYKSKPKKHERPPLGLLMRGEKPKYPDYGHVVIQKEIIDKTLRDFRIGGRVVEYTKGPSVTQFEITLDPGVKVERVKNISRNLQMNLEGKSIRIEAPIPGKSTIGIEVPNQIREKVMFGDLISNPEFLSDGNPLNTVLGIDIGGNFVNLDIIGMPHALIAGTTGSGKSVCINSIINSILYKANPEEVKLILIDPKLIEFACYEDIPHLATPVINDPKLATVALKWAVEEMESRYELFRAYKRRDFQTYNEFAQENSDIPSLPYIVIIIDELADLMFIAASSVEEYIQRLAQKARAAGIHLIMATQRPSTDVIKGTIKANIQTRIAFAVNSQVDSMTILDKSGADKLLGQGDMLYSDGVNEIRVQGAFISLDEITAVTDYIKTRSNPDFMFSREDLTQKMQREESTDDPTEDEYFSIIARDVVESDNASINRIQKTYGIGFNRAQSIMMGLEELGIVSEGIAGRPRRVLVTIEELEAILNQ